MKTKMYLFMIILMIIPFVSFSQDSLYLHKGDVLFVKIVRISEGSVIYHFSNEDAEQTVGKYAVGSIKYEQSGRVEKITDKIEITGENDWEKVKIIRDKSEAIGLENVGEVKGKTSLFNYRSLSGGDKKAEEKIKKAAAKLLAPFIYLNSDKVYNLGNAYSGSQVTGSWNSSPTNKTWGSTQTAKQGIAYKY